jgi:allophanate hydrolase subunit 2
VAGRGAAERTDDDLSFRLGNQALGNAEHAAGLECTRPVRRCASAIRPRSV